MMVPEKTVKKFNEYVEKKEGCWEWKGSKSNKGYGTLTLNKKTIGAHRVSWLIHKGEFDRSLFVLHKCDNPPCTNPEHLFLGTHQDNMRDKMEKGRAPGVSYLDLLEENKEFLQKLYDSLPAYVQKRREEFLNSLPSLYFQTGKNFKYVEKRKKRRKKN